MTGKTKIKEGGRKGYWKERVHEGRVGAGKGEQKIHSLISRRRKRREGGKQETTSDNKWMKGRLRYRNG